jgi:hypothetical protein
MLSVRVRCATWWIVVSVRPRYTPVGTDVTQEQDEALPNTRVRFREAVRQMLSIFLRSCCPIPRNVLMGFSAFAEVPTFPSQLSPS